MITFDFEGKTALVTGATKGIGRAIGVRLLESGAKVALSYSSDDIAARETASYLKERKLTDYLLIKSDVSDRDDVRELLRECREKWSEPVSYIVNNAGILKQGDFFGLSDEQWERTFEVNLKGPFMISQECLRHMGLNGAIVNIASVGGQIGGDKAPDYAASKAGLICLTRSIARIGSRYGVRVNAVAPGWIETPIFTKERLAELKKEAGSVIPLGRMGTPEEVASAVLFLLSDAASFITGHCLNVNGGQYFG